MQDKNGQYRIVEAVCTNLLGHETINGLVANYRDITEKAALEKQKEEFIGIASHELKTRITNDLGIALNAGNRRLQFMAGDPDKFFLLLFQRVFFGNVPVVGDQPINRLMSQQVVANAFTNPVVAIFMLDPDLCPYLLTCR